MCVPEGATAYRVTDVQTVATEYYNNLALNTGIDNSAHKAFQIDANHYYSLDTFINVSRNCINYPQDNCVIDLYNLDPNIEVENAKQVSFVLSFAGGTYGLIDRPEKFDDSVWKAIEKVKDGKLLSETLDNVEIFQVQGTATPAP